MRNGAFIMNVVVSILVHEEPKVVVDQIRNIQYFVPNTTIVLHVSKNFKWPQSIKNFDLSEFNKVYINPTRLPTKWATGSIALAHISNFKYISEICDFDYFLLQASNELFVAKGVEEYICNYDAGLRQLAAAKWHWWSRRGVCDENLRKMVESSGVDQIYHSMCEGTFYKKSVFEGMVSITDGFLQDTKDPEKEYPKEETYFPTAASKIAKKIGLPYSYIVLTRPSVSIEEINIIRKKEYPLLNIKRPSICGEKFFAVKKVPRKIYDPIRIYIKGLTKNKFVFIFYAGISLLLILLYRLTQPLIYSLQTIYGLLPTPVKNVWRTIKRLLFLRR